MSHRTVRVVKVGGSLFDWPEFPDRLWLWLQAQPPAANYFVAGGGDLADAIRKYDRLLELGEARSHRLCIDLLHTTGKMLEYLLALARARNKNLPQRQLAMSVLDVAAHLRSPDLTVRVPIPLPQTWKVTTDSIAAHLAEMLNAHELVLLKSASLDGSCASAVAAERGYVDPFFPQAAARLAKIRAVNLREEQPAEWILFP